MKPRIKLTFTCISKKHLKFKILKIQLLMLRQTFSSFPLSVIRNFTLNLIIILKTYPYSDYFLPTLLLPFFVKSTIYSQLDYGKNLLIGFSVSILLYSLLYL